MGKIHKDVTVVGLRGPAGAGKTTLAKEWHTILNRGYTTRLVSFAGPIKDGLAAMGICKGAQPEAYRYFAQEIGGGMRARNNDHWVDIFRKVVVASAPSYQVVVADDLRYPNEAALCDVIFRITPLGFNVTDLGERADHESEMWNRLDKTTGIEIINENGFSSRAAGAMHHYIQREVKETTR